ncbi:MAG TPA: N-acetyl-gamma-glutamyl-phosphate reductase [Anaerolineae bacterium]|nr:N-acetyl-gamma-glutamyl-phosphate reductase [Anaerolineae bacterium]
MIQAGIIGVTGYTGIELYKLLRGHPAAEIAWLTSESYAGQRLSDVFPCPWDDALLFLAKAPLAQADVVFLCLPHAASMPAVAAARAAGARVIDLSADFRLHDAATYERWYDVPHTEPALLAEAIYGLPELHRAEITGAGLVANPGCYPTSVILGLAPLARAGWLVGQVIVDSKSGVSGAGRKAKLSNSFVEANENLSPYSIGYSHRHIAEMEQELLQMAGGKWQVAGGKSQVAGGKWRIVFSPHLLPVSRGILSTMYVTLPEGVEETAVRAVYNQAYAGEPFVHLLPAGQLATLHHVVHSNRCAIGLTLVPGTTTLIVTSAIDNLLKGASGQAVQNMNVMFGLVETIGLEW